jgi:hypothetical protein
VPLVLALVLLAFGSGCTRFAYTRVFLHGDIQDEDGRPVPFAIVRLGPLETLADENGHYRMLVIANCLHGLVGIQGVQTPELETYAYGYEPTSLGFHLDTIEMAGGGSCPADSDKLVRVAMVRKF